MSYVRVLVTGVVLGLVLAGCVGDPAVESATAAQEVAVLADADHVCTSGSLLCCQQFVDSTPQNLAALGGLLGIALPNLGGQIGLSCSPISILGIGGNSCSSQPACCVNNSFGGLIALGCTPVNLNQ